MVPCPNRNTILAPEELCLTLLGDFLAGLVRFLLPRIGERGVVFIGLIGMGIGYAVIAAVGSCFAVSWAFVAGALLFSASEGGSGPAMQGLISNSVSHREQGWVMGGLQSMNSAARVIGPILAGLLYAGLGHSAPYWFGLVVILGVLVYVSTMLSGGRMDRVKAG